MKKILMLVLSLLPILSKAQWPTFFIPSPEQLASTMILDTSECPFGFAKVHKGTVISVKNFSMNYSPSAWVWQVLNDSECFDLKTLSYLNTTFEYVYANGLIQKSIITAHYSSKNSPLFSLYFSSPSENWYCVQLEKNQNVITCTNDM